MHLINIKKYAIVARDIRIVDTFIKAKAKLDNHRLNTNVLEHRTFLVMYTRFHFQEKLWVTCLMWQTLAWACKLHISTTLQRTSLWFILKNKQNTTLNYGFSLILLRPHRTHVCVFQRCTCSRCSTRFSFWMKSILVRLWVSVEIRRCGNDLSTSLGLNWKYINYDEDDNDEEIMTLPMLLQRQVFFHMPAR